MAANAEQLNLPANRMLGQPADDDDHPLYFKTQVSVKSGLAESSSVSFGVKLSLNKSKWS